MQNKTELSLDPIWQTLPLDPLIHIFSFIIPEFDYFKIENNRFWQDKFEKHFPDDIPLEYNYSQFAKMYKIHYGELPFSTRELFSLLKERDVSGLKEKLIDFKLLDSKDGKSKTILYWAQRIGNQPILNYFYQLAQDYFRLPEGGLDLKKKDDQGRNIMYWALACHQKLDHILALLDQATSDPDLLFDLHYLQGKHLIHIAAEQGLLDIVEHFVISTPDILELFDVNRKTSLLIAATAGQDSVLDYLISQKAELKNSLYPAIVANQINSVIKIIQAGANSKEKLINFTKLDKEIASKVSILQWAQQIGNPIILDYFYQLAQDYFRDMDQKDGKGRTLLHWAVACRQPLNHILALAGNPEKREYLMDLRDLQGRHLIHIAAEQGLLDVVEYLAQSNPEYLEFEDNEGLTPIVFAAGTGKASVLDYLISQNVKWNGSLFYATKNGQSTSAIKLIRAGADLYERGKSKHYVIHAAAHCGLLNVVQELINRDPNLLEQENDYHETALLCAVASNHEHVVDYLMAQNANVNSISVSSYDHLHNGRSVLWWAIEKKCSINIISKLLRAGANHTLTLTINQIQPIHKAVVLRNLPLVKMLTAHDPKVIEAVNIQGDTPLILAAGSGYGEIVDYLILKEANLNATSIQDHFYPDIGKTALHYACEYGRNETAIKLIQAGADLTLVSQERKEGAIHLAAKKGLLNVVQELLKYNPALLDLINKFGDTPLMIAAKEEKLDVFNYLIVNAKRMVDVAGWRHVIFCVLKTEPFDKAMEYLEETDALGNTALYHLLLRPCVLQTIVDILSEENKLDTVKIKLSKERFITGKILSILSEPNEKGFCAFAKIFIEAYKLLQEMQPSHQQSFFTPNKEAIKLLTSFEASNSLVEIKEHLLNYINENPNCSMSKAIGPKLLGISGEESNDAYPSLSS